MLETALGSVPIMASSMAQVPTGLATMIGVDSLILRRVFDSNLWQFVDEKCKNDLQLVVDGLKSMELWSYKLLDASTKIPNGILTGNLMELGNYNECLDIQFPKSDATGQHCLAQLGLSNLSSIDDNLQMQPMLTWSYCIPSTCSAQNLKHVLNSIWFNLTGASADVSYTDCQTEGEGWITNEDIVSITICTFFLLLCLISTIYDVWQHCQNNRINTLLASFSFYTNGKKLIRVGNRVDSMQCLDGMRFLSMCWIVFGHRYFFVTFSPIMNLAEVSNITKDLSFQLVAGAVLSVDTFFMLSGLLNSYYLFKILDKTQSFPIFKFYFHRYIRTTPALAAIVLMFATWYSRIGDGPIWRRIVEPNQIMCAKYWWSTLLYINNYYNPLEQCAGQSWYLAVDMQLYWISPLIIIPCWRWPSFSKFYLTSLVLLVTAAQSIVAYIDKFRMSFSFTQDMQEYARVTQYMYVPTHMRATPYIIGIMLGIYLYHQRKFNRNLSLTKMMVVAGWAASTALCLTVILGNYPFIQPETDHPYNRLESTFYISLHRIAWCAGLSWIIISCLHGHGGFVNSILSWDGFVPLSRLTYCIFLTHIGILQYQIGTMRTSAYFQHFDQFHRYFGDLAMTIIASVILSLIFESPMIIIEKYFFETKKTNNLAMGSVNVGFVDDDAKKSDEPSF